MDPDWECTIRVYVYSYNYNIILSVSKTADKPFSSCEWSSSFSVQKTDLWNVWYIHPLFEAQYNPSCSELEQNLLDLLTPKKPILSRTQKGLVLKCVLGALACLLPFPSSGIAACQAVPGFWNFGNEDAFIGDAKNFWGCEKNSGALLGYVIHSGWVHSETVFASFNNSWI